MPEADDQMRMNAHTQLVLLQRAIEQISPEDSELNTLQALLEKLGTHSYTIAVVGEFNRGKSTLINALLGMPILPADVIPTTATVNRIIYADQPSLTLRMQDGREESLPLQALSAYITKLNAESEAASQLVREAVIGYPTVFCRDHVSILDTPGMNESQEMNELTLRTACQADALIFVIHALIPYSTSEATLLCQLLASPSIQSILFTVSFIDRVQQEPGMEERVLSGIRQRIQRVTLPLIEQNTAWSAEEKAQKKAMLENASVLGVSARKALDAFVSGNREALSLSRIASYKTELMTQLTAQQRAWEERELMPYLRQSPAIFQAAVARRQQALHTQIDTASSHLLNACQQLNDLMTIFHTQRDSWYNAVVSMPLPQEEELLRDCFPTQRAQAEEVIAPGSLVEDPAPAFPLVQGFLWLRQKTFQKGIYRDSATVEGTQLRTAFDSAKKRIAAVWIPAVNEHASALFQRCYAQCQAAEAACCQEMNQAALALHAAEGVPVLPPCPALLLLKGSDPLDALSFPVWGNLDKLDKVSVRLEKHLHKAFRKWVEKSALEMKNSIFPDATILAAPTETLKALGQQLASLKQQLDELTSRAEEVGKIFFGTAATQTDTPGEPTTALQDITHTSTMTQKEEQP